MGNRRAFFRKYPDIKPSENIKCLSLLLKKEFAEAIINGEKTVEFRNYTKYYCGRLYDAKLVQYGDAHVSDKDMEDFVDFTRPLRKVETIHFHNYNNTWSLDVEVIDNWTVIVDKAGVQDMQEAFGCHELDGLLEELEEKKATERPIFFYFALGKVISKTGI